MMLLPRTSEYEDYPFDLVDMPPIAVPCLYEICSRTSRVVSEKYQVRVRFRVGNRPLYFGAGPNGKLVTGRHAAVRGRHGVRPFGDFASVA